MLNDRLNASQTLPQRPVVYDYRSPVDFLNAMAIYNRATLRRFSIRQAVARVGTGSPSLITLVLQGKRRLTRDQLPIFAQVFQLTYPEAEYLDRSLKVHLPNSAKTTPTAEKRPRSSRIPRNHLLQDWLHAYVKDCCELRGFQPEPQTVYRLLGGIARPERIARSIQFLFREGFWRKTAKKKTVVEENLVVSTQEIPQPKIRDFHRAALKIAEKGLSQYSTDRRKASTVLISVNSESMTELRKLVQRFHQDLLDFVDHAPDGDEQLCQVTIHLTPLGGKNAD